MLTNVSDSWIIHIHCPKFKAKRLAFIIFFLFVLSFLNGSIILVLVRKHHRLSIVNTLILHLSTADFMVSSTSIAQAVLAMFGSPLASGFFCKVGGFIARFTYCSSISLITIMAISRCYSVVKPIEYHTNISRSQVNKICFGAWGLSLISSATPIFGWAKYEPSHYGQCMCTFNSHNYPYNWFIFCFVFYAFPSIVNIVVFGWTAKVFVRRNIITSAKKQIENEKRSQTSTVPNSDLSTTTTATSTGVCFDTLNDGIGNQTSNMVVVEVHADIHTSGESENQACQQAKRGSKIRPRVWFKQANKIGGEREIDTKQIEATEEITIDAEIHIVTEFDATEEDITQIDTKKIDQIAERKESEIAIQAEIVDVVSDSMDTEEDIMKIEEDVPSTTNTERVPPLQRYNPDSTQTPQRLQPTTRKKVISRHKVLLVAIFCASFVLLCGPTFFVKSWYALQPLSVPEIAFSISSLISFVNLVINPFLYGLLSQEIRSDIRKLLCC